MRIFIDTSGFKAYFDKKDENHEKALEMVERIEKEGHEIITTDYVFDETITLTRVACDLRTALKFSRMIAESNIVSLVNIDKEIFRDALKIFEKYSEVNLSFTDCTSFVVMKNHGIKKYFSFDKHFRIFGEEFS